MIIRAEIVQETTLDYSCFFTPSSGNLKNEDRGFLHRCRVPSFLPTSLPTCLPRPLLLRPDTGHSTTRTQRKMFRVQGGWGRVWVHEGRTNPSTKRGGHVRTVSVRHDEVGDRYWVIKDHRDHSEIVGKNLHSKRFATTLSYALPLPSYIPSTLSHLVRGGGVLSIQNSRGTFLR